MENLSNENDVSINKHVWIVNHYAQAPHKGDGTGRHFGMARHLTESGWSASVIGATTRHPDGRQVFESRKLAHTRVEDGVTFRWVRANRYRGNVTRIANMMSFAIGLLLPSSTEGLPKPDVVIGSTVHPLAAWSAAKLAKRHDAPFVFEIRDVWPDALVHLGWIESGSPIERSINTLMRSLASQARAVISPLEAVKKYTEKLGLQRSFKWISNGIEAQQDLPNDAPVSDEFNFMYLGSFGHAMDIETQLRAYEKFVLTDPSRPSKFRLVGDGPRLDEVRSFARSLSCSDRIIFEPRIPRQDVLERAREAHCLVHALHDHRVYDYGLSPNKLYDYLLSGRPILFACSAPETPLTGSGGGIIVPAEDSDSLANAMEQVAVMSQEERDRMGTAGRNYVLDNFTYSTLAKRLVKVLDKVYDDSKNDKGEFEKPNV